MNLRPDEINKLIKEQIRNYEGRLETAQYGTVVQVGDGIARVYGLDNAMAGELYEMYASLNQKSSSLVCSGNGIRKNAALKKIAGEVFSQQVKVPLYKEEAAYGAALSSMAGTGVYKSLDEARTLIKYEGE